VWDRDQGHGGDKIPHHKRFTIRRRKKKNKEKGKKGVKNLRLALDRAGRTLLKDSKEGVSVEGASKRKGKTGG